MGLDEADEAIEQNQQKRYRLEIFREDTFESIEGANKFSQRLNMERDRNAKKWPG